MVQYLLDHTTANRLAPFEIMMILQTFFLYHRNSNSLSYISMLHVIILLLLFMQFFGSRLYFRLQLCIYLIIGVVSIFIVICSKIKTNLFSVLSSSSGYMFKDNRLYSSCLTRSKFYWVKVIFKFSHLYLYKMNNYLHPGICFGSKVCLVKKISFLIKIMINYINRR